MLFSSSFALAVASLVAFLPATTVLAQNGSSVYDALQSNPQTSQFYSYLASSSVASQLQNTNNTNGTYTIFAPSNSAFTPQVQALLSTNSDINDIFLYHIVNGSYPSNQFRSGSNIVNTLVSNSTLNKWSNSSGLPLNVYKNPSSNNGSGVELHYGFYKSNVIQTDSQASNGVIHVIDSIMNYPLSPSATIRSSDQASDQKLRVFYGALVRVGLLDSLDSANGITIFAPRDDAFGDVNLVNLSNDTLSGILKYHIVDGVYYSTNVTGAGNTVTLTTRNGTHLNATSSGSSVEVGNRNTTGKVVTPDVLTNNGVLHIIDTLLIPPANENGTANGTSSGNGAKPNAASTAGVSRSALLLSVAIVVCTFFL